MMIVGIGMKEEKTVCFSGHRISRLPKGGALKILESRLYVEINKSVASGFDTFLFGACYGFDFIAAKQVMRLKNEKFPNIKLIAIVPFEEQADNWSKRLYNEYYNILSQCDKVVTLHSGYNREHYLERNRYMIDHSSLLICYYDGGKGGTEQTVLYAELKKVNIINLF